MANLTATPDWTPVRQLEQNELAAGGPNGNMNEQAKALLNRTEYLNQQKADKEDIIQGQYSFATLAEFNAVKATIPVNSTVIIDEAGANQGTNTWNGTTLTKSAYDPLTQAKSYTDTSISNLVVTPKKTNFMLESKNLFNKNSAQSGYLVNPTTGVLQASASYTTSQSIIVVGNTNYYMGGGRAIAFYDANNVFISGIDSPTNAIFGFTTPANAKYLKISFLSTKLNTMQLELGTAATSYVNYSFSLGFTDNTPILVDGANLKANSLITSSIADDAITPPKTNFLQPTKNLFNKRTAQIGYLINATSGFIAASANYDTSDYIPVSGATQYFSKGASQPARAVAFYDVNKTLLTGGLTGNTETFTTPANCAYIIISIYHVDYDSFQLELGSVRTSFIDYGFTLSITDGTPIITNSSTASTWSDKQWAAIGDSITFNATWISYVTSRLGLVNTNYGSSGTKISGTDATAMCNDARINAIPTTVDLVTLMGGTNDWAQNVPLGAIDSTDPTTFNGALNTFAQKAFARWPTKRIAVATTPYGEIVDWTGRAGWTSPAKNSLGLTTNDYAEAIRQFCKRMNLHCIDVALMAGYGTYNITEAMGGSTTDHLHPAAGSNAAKGIGAAHIAALSQIAPIA